MASFSCYCGSGNTFQACCQPVHKNPNLATTAEKCMRSRYAAYCDNQLDYLVESTHPSKRKHYTKKNYLAWAKIATFVKLEILLSTEKTVEFKAYYQEKGKLEIHVHHELSTFSDEHGRFYYFDGFVNS